MYSIVLTVRQLTCKHPRKLPTSYGFISAPKFSTDMSENFDFGV